MTNIFKMLDKAVQLAEIASDWHLDEVEIDGEMVSIYDLRDEFKAALEECRAEPRWEPVEDGTYITLTVESDEHVSVIRQHHSNVILLNNEFRLCRLVSGQDGQPT